ncbi:sugar transferase [uncultured Ilyobacter sp.]|uniref:sugar transferase n=1 Tax=uncultured Ilyobacter sp. TaxID=544433 RepID=UPI0029C02B5E|nr:sugar transferase [uncultured Ilyobacter sp.]
MIIPKTLLNIFLITAQFLLYFFLSYLFKIETRFIIYSFFIYFILNFFKGTYSLNNNLVWEDLKKQLQIHSEFFAIIIITNLVFFGLKYVWFYIFLSVTFIFFNIFFTNFIKNHFWKYLKKKILVIGTGSTAKQFSKLIKIHHSSMYQLVGFVQINGGCDVPKDQIVCKYSELLDYVKANPIDQIIVALPGKSLKDLNWRKISNDLDGHVKKLKFIPDNNGIFNLNSKIQDYDGLLLITATNQIHSKCRNIVKRIMDILLSLGGIFILGILVLLFSKKIRKDGGPIFFKHSRIGKDLKEFKIYKFRTMYVDAETRLQDMLKDETKREEYYNNFKLKDDPRITPIGKFLRESSLDEFPQFINVLRGEMSLVGPRPIVKKELELHYGDEIGKKVFQIKPGITGMWQSHGRSDVEDYEERITSDLYYIRNWSLWLDIVLLLQTIKYVLNRKGAY